MRDIKASRSLKRTIRKMTRSWFHFLDAWLWRRGIGHPVIRPLLRNEILLSALLLAGGALLWSKTDWVFWFGVGTSIMTLTFWSLSRFFLCRDLSQYSSTLLWGVLLRWLARLAGLTVLLYVVLIECRAPVIAILGGLTAATAVALGSFALASRNRA